MTEHLFWSLIETAKGSRTNPWDLGAQTDALEELLCPREKASLVAFEIILRKNLQSLFQPHILELAVMLKNHFEQEAGRIRFDEHLSDEEFLTFRCWLILQGKELVDAILACPQCLPDHGIESYSDMWADELLSVADTAFSAEHDNPTEYEIREAAIDLYPEFGYEDEDEALEAMNIWEDLDRKYPFLIQHVLKMRTAKAY
ncbi:DUF4240 domain-containing protein [Pontibacter sp. G13]|uniref:DUF4240 domain-containing protein n=1 Tax=Pontibacter sp. G13 TaxID=3074898 RepID=UPI00288A0BBD|nr:DUF4240 domain-containing protein [Pontibacter sp. G13]WNJ17658.1 DUF4240 domain-containing protein [Pontibacter sp. G13]